jgi:hypothetical protein
MLWRTTTAESRAICRLFQSLQDQAADALAGILGLVSVEVESPHRVERGIFVAQAESTVRDRADATPFPLSDPKYFFQQPLGSNIAFRSHGPRVLVFHFAAPFFKLTDAHGHTLQ